MSHTTEQEKPERRERTKRGPRREGESGEGDRPRRPLPASLADRPSMEEMQAKQKVFQESTRALFQQIDTLKAKREALTERIKEDDKGHSGVAAGHRVLRNERSEIMTALNAAFEKQKAINAELKAIEGKRRAILDRLPFRSAEEAEKKMKALDTERLHGSLSFQEENDNINEKKAIKEALPLLEELASFDGRREELRNDRTAQSAEIDALKKKRADVEKRMDAAGFDPKAHEAARNALFAERTAVNEQMTELYAQVRANKEQSDAIFQAYRTAVEEWKVRKESVFARQREMRDLKSRIYELVQKRRDIEKRQDRLAAPDMRVVEAADVVLAVLAGVLQQNEPKKAAAESGPQGPVECDGVVFAEVGSRGGDAAFMGTGTKGKKGKRSKRRAAKREAQPEGRGSSFQTTFLDPAFLQQCALCNVTPPATLEAIPAMIEEIKAKRAEAEQKETAAYEAATTKVDAEHEAVNAQIKEIEAQLSELQAKEREEVKAIKARQAAAEEAEAAN